TARRTLTGVRRRRDTPRNDAATATRSLLHPRGPSKTGARSRHFPRVKQFIFQRGTPWPLSPATKTTTPCTERTATTRSQDLVGMISSADCQARTGARGG